MWSEWWFEASFHPYGLERFWDVKSDLTESLFSSSKNLYVRPLSCLLYYTPLRFCGKTTTTDGQPHQPVPVRGSCLDKDSQQGESRYMRDCVIDKWTNYTVSAQPTGHHTSLPHSVLCWRPYVVHYVAAARRSNGCIHDKWVVGQMTWR